MINHIDITKIDPNPWQTRRQGGNGQEHIAELAKSIETKGLMQFPVGRVHPGDETRVQLAFGHRRWAALQSLGDDDMPVDIRQLSDEDMADYAWDENEERQDVSPMEKAIAIQERIDDFGWTHEQIAERLGMSRAGVTNLLRLMKLPAEIKDGVHEGTLSVRQAEAALAITELPEDVLDEAEQGMSWLPPSETLNKIATGELTSDEIRNRAKTIKRQYTNRLSGAIYPLSEPFIQGDEIVSERCDQCPERIQDGSEMACAKSGCWDAKTDAWKSQILSLASADSGIPLLELAEGENYYSATHRWYDDRFTLGEKGIFATGCDNLRLTFDCDVSETNALDLEQHPGVRIVCHHGEKGRCACVDERRDAVTTQEQAELEADPEYVERQQNKQLLEERIVAPATAAVYQALADDSAMAWLRVYRKIGRTAGSEKWDVEMIKERIARHLVEAALPYMNPEDDLHVSRSEVIDKLLQPLGLESALALRDDEDPVAELEEQYERIQGWIDTLEVEIPPLETVQGNIVNLGTIVFQLETLSHDYPDDERIDQLFVIIQEKIERLSMIMQVVEQAGGLDIDRIYNLLTYDMDDGYGETVVKGAGPAELQYALALVDDGDPRGEALRRAVAAEL